MSPAQRCRVSLMNAPCSRFWLDLHRQTLLMKCAGLSVRQLKLRSAAPSTLTLHGLVRHMAEVERDWFRICFAGQDISNLYSTEAWPTADFDDLASADPATDFATFAEEVRLARAVTVGGARLKARFVRRNERMAMNLHGSVHLIEEEYNRHGTCSWTAATVTERGEVVGAARGRRAGCLPSQAPGGQRAQRREAVGHTGRGATARRVRLLQPAGSAGLGACGCETYWEGVTDGKTSDRRGERPLSVSG